MPIELGALRAALAGRYEIQRELGAGGMAVVYLADDVRHGRKVAVKVLRPELAASLGAERFLREIQISAGLTHPHILPLYDSGQASGFLYYVMPYIEGETLRDRLDREGPLPLADARQITAEVADAVECAHAQGLIHRDIKPENILLSGGHAVVADFGLARAVEQSGGDKLTRSGLSVGTPAYTSPEQAFGDGPVDGRTDVYSLGVVVYEMLSGDRPYAGSSARAIFARMTTETPTSLRALRAAVPEVMEHAVMRALAKLPADRFATPGEFAQALRGGAARFAGSPARGIWTRFAGNLKYSTALNRTAGAVVTVLLLGTAAWLWPGIRAATDGQQGPASRLEAGSLPRLTGPTVAVLPFTNLTGDPALEANLNTLDGQVRTELESPGDMVVKARTSVLAAMSSEASLRDIGRTLDADVVVENSVSTIGDSVIVTVRARDTDSERSIWTGTYRSSIQDPGHLVLQLPRQIASELRRALDPAAKIDLRQVHVPPDAAVKAFNDAHAPVPENASQEDRIAAGNHRIELLREIVKIDPNWALAWARLGRAWDIAGSWAGWRSPHEVYPEAMNAYERAIELDSTLAEALLGQATLYYVYRWNWAKAEEGFQRAIRANPSLADARDWYGNFLRAMNRPEEGVEQLEQAVKLDPLSANHLAELRQQYQAAGRKREADEVARRAKKLDPSGWAARFSYALALCEEGKMREAADSMRTNFTPAFAAWMYAVAGSEEEARSLLAELEGKPNVNHLPVAHAYVTLGDTATALDWLELGLTERHPHMVWLNPASREGKDGNGLCSALPAIDLTGQPRYQAILDRLDFAKETSDSD